MPRVPGEMDLDPEMQALAAALHPDDGDRRVEAVKLLVAYTAEVLKQAAEARNWAVRKARLAGIDPASGKRLNGRKGPNLKPGVRD